MSITQAAMSIIDSTRQLSFEKKTTFRFKTEMKIKHKLLVCKDVKSKS